LLKTEGNRNAHNIWNSWNIEASIKPLTVLFAIPLSIIGIISQYTSGPGLIPMSVSAGSGHILEYVATFPNVSVNSGDEYKACVLTIKEMNLKCGTGYNPPANRPEFIDINLDDTSTDESESLELDGTDGMEDEVEITTAAASSESG
jgi:hypothetical protein